MRTLRSILSTHGMSGTPRKSKLGEIQLAFYTGDTCGSGGGLSEIPAKNIGPVPTCLPIVRGKCCLSGTGFRTNWGLNASESKITTTSPCQGDRGREMDQFFARGSSWSRSGSFHLRRETVPAVASDVCLCCVPRFVSHEISNWDMIQDSSVQNMMFHCHSVILIGGQQSLKLMV